MQILRRVNVLPSFHVYFKVLFVFSYLLLTYESVKYESLVHNKTVSKLHAPLPCVICNDEKML